YRPRELGVLAAQLIELLDQDGPEPDDREPAQVNELHLTRTPTHLGAGAGGRIKGVLDAVTFDALTTALGALTRTPTTGDTRTVGERQADALGELCLHALDRGELPSVGGQRPHLNITIGLAELEGRARGAVLDSGARLTPTQLRMLACDAFVIPAVLGGNGQPLDLGRSVRIVSPAMRRAVVIRDRGCAFPGCGRPPSACQVHHILPWELGGATDLCNCVMLCTFHHHLLHHDSHWRVRIRAGQPEFIPPTWIDPQQIPRRRPPPGDFPAPQRAGARQSANGEPAG
ncbi:MAG: DUF222 domain-containing protein, partial [Pseudonocardiaceae bacterium]